MQGLRDWLWKYYTYRVTVYHPSTQRIEVLAHRSFCSQEADAHCLFVYDNWSAPDKSPSADHLIHDRQSHVAPSDPLPQQYSAQVSEATDPYSVALAADGARTQFASLDAPELKPDGWEGHSPPPLASHLDTSIYELHIRDFRCTRCLWPSQSPREPTGRSLMPVESALMTRNGVKRTAHPPRMLRPQAVALPSIHARQIAQDTDICSHRRCHPAPQRVGRQRAGGAARQVRRLWPGRQPWNGALAGAAGGGLDARAPAAGVRLCHRAGAAARPAHAPGEVLLSRVSRRA